MKLYPKCPMCGVTWTVEKESDDSLSWSVKFECPHQICPAVDAMHRLAETSPPKNDDAKNKGNG